MPNSTLQVGKFFEDDGLLCVELDGDDVGLLAAADGAWSWRVYFAMQTSNGYPMWSHGAAGMGISNAQYLKPDAAREVWRKFLGDWEAPQQPELFA